MKHRSRKICFLRKKKKRKGVRILRSITLTESPENSHLDAFIKSLGWNVYQIPLEKYIYALEVKGRTWQMTGPRYTFCQRFHQRIFFCHRKRYKFNCQLSSTDRRAVSQRPKAPCPDTKDYGAGTCLLITEIGVK